MRARLFYLLNGLTAVITLALLAGQFFGNRPVAYSYEAYLGATAEPIQVLGPTHLSMVSFPGEDSPPGSAVSLVAYPLLPNGMPLPVQSLPNEMPLPVQPLSLFSQPDPAMCETDGVEASPNGHDLIVQYNCEAGVFARLLKVNGRIRRRFSWKMAIFWIGHRMGIGFCTAGVRTRYG